MCTEHRAGRSVTHEQCQYCSAQIRFTHPDGYTGHYWGYCPHCLKVSILLYGMPYTYTGIASGFLHLQLEQGKKYQESVVWSGLKSCGMYFHIEDDTGYKNE